MIAPLAMLVLLAGAPPDAWKPIPASPGYRFCEAPGADAANAREWCGLLADLPPDACPGLRETCAGDAPDAGEDPNDLLSRLSRGCDDGGGDAGGYSPPPPPPPPPSRAGACDGALDGTGLAALLRWVVAITVAVAVLAVARWVFLRFVGWRREPEPPPRVVPSAAPEKATVDVPNRPSGDLLSEAEAALAAGRYGETVLLARAAALRRLGERGAIALTASRTDREYLRAIRPEDREPLRAIVRATEAVRWARSAIGEPEARSAFSAAERLIRGLSVGLVLAVLAAPDAARAESRYGAAGDAGWLDAFQRAGYDASWRLRGLSDIEDDLDVLVLDLGHTTIGDADARSLRDWVGRGGLLVTVGDASAIADLGALADVAEPGPMALTPALAATDLPTPVLPGGPTSAWAAPTGLVWVALPDGRAVVQSLTVEAGQILAVSDGRLLTNGALLSRENEGFLVAAPYAWPNLVAELPADAPAGTPFLTPIPARLQLATRAGTTSNSPIASMWNAKLLPVILQVLLVAALGALWRGWPFATPRDDAMAERTSFSDHLRALGSRWHRIGASRWALGQYARYVLDRRGESGLRQAALRQGRTPDEADALVARAAAAAAAPDGPSNPTEDLNLMEELWTLHRRP